MLDFIIISPARSFTLEECEQFGARGMTATTHGRLLGRLAVRACLNQYLASKTQGENVIRMRHSIFGKPEIEGNHMHCGISYTDNLAVLVVGKGQVGVDIQYDNTDWDTLGSARKHANCLHKLWVARESVAKFLSVGLNIDLLKIEIPAISEKKWHRAKVNVFPFSGQDVFLREILITHRYKAVIAADSPRQIRKVFMHKGPADSWVKARWS